MYNIHYSLINNTLFYYYFCYSLKKRQQVIDCLKQLEPECETQAEYRDLTLLLTLTRLDQHPDYRYWNPSLGRLQCFNQVSFNNIDK